MKSSLYIILVLAVMAGVSSSCAPSEPELPNIVYIIADDISWDDFGCYGNEDVRTPNIDRMASEGLLFNNVYLTASSCSPSRTSIISGRYPHNTGSAELHTPLATHLTAFPEQLQEAGYYTGASGKWHMGEAPKSAFDTLAIKDFGMGGEDHWINLLRERPEDQPFFFWFASIDAHRDWSADTIAAAHDPEKLSVPVVLADMPATKQDLASYYNEIWRFDYFVGLVWDELKKQGVAENTLIIVMADNGRPFPRSKTRVYDSGMKTPFIAWWPDGIEYPGTETDALVSVIDIAPTLVSIAGEEPDKYYQGRSFAEVIKGNVSEFRNYVFSEHNWHDYEAYERMVRTKDFLYVYNGRNQFPNQGPADAVSSPSMSDLRILRDQESLAPDQADVFIAPRPAEELFDCRTDIEQVYNVIDDPGYTSVKRDLAQVLLQWQTETGDTEPDSLTPDWYIRDAETYIKTEMHGVRGIMPGTSSGADTITAGGPF